MKLLLWVCVVFIPLAVFAQVPGVSPVPSPLAPVLIPIPSDNPGLVSTITGLISLARGWQSLGFYVALGTALKYLVDVSQLSFLGAPFSKIPVKFQLLVRSGVSAIIAILGFIAGGAPIITAVVAGLGTGAGAGFIHELLADFVPGSVPPVDPPSAA